MSRSPLHDRQKKKNWAVLAALVLFILTIYFVTIIRLKGG